MKRWFGRSCIALAGLLMLGGCAAPTAEYGKASDKTASSAFEEIQMAQPATLAEAAGRRLEYDPATRVFRIVEGGREIWASGVSDEAYGEKAAGNPAISNGIKQLFSLTYTDFALRSGAINSGSNPQIRYGKLERGLKMAFYFDTMQVGLTLEVSLDDKGRLKVRVPRDGIREDGSMAVTSLDLLPMMGASANGEDGYMLYPDGSGALYTFDKTIPASGVSPLRTDFYGDVSMDMDKALRGEEQGIAPKMLPVYGVRRGDSSFLAVVTSGDAYSGVTLSPSGFVYELNRICSSVKYRKSFVYVTPENKEQIITERDSSVGDVELLYLFQQGDEAGYGGMAAAYQQYLVETGQLEKSATSPDGYPMAVDFLMNAQEKTMLWDKRVEMTSPSEARDILEDLREAGVREVQTILWGWQSSGWGSYPSFGGPQDAGGLGKLAAYAGETGVPLYLAQDFLRAESGRSGYSNQGDTVYNLMNLPVTDKANEWYYLSVDKAWDQWKKQRRTAEKLDGVGSAFSGIGRVLTENYRKGAVVSRRQTADQYGAMLDEAKGLGGPVAVEGGNAYLLGRAERLYHLPDRASGYLEMDEAVPFYQMVVHGYLPYSGSVPYNLASDPSYTKLKWIEYGAMPYFLITNENTSALNRSTCDWLLSGEYDFWKEDIVSVYKEFSGELAGLFERRMTGHRELAPGVYETVYDSGARVRVNYTDKAYTADGVTVGAEDFQVIKGG